jgi:CelD/BcsL family acetyltransferase involved in cellulose biosynthesis
MRISVVRPAELGPGELAAWRAMQAAQPALDSPFLAPEFTLAVGAFRDDARVAVLEDGSTLAGFLPFERRALGIGKPIGAGLSDCQGLVHAPGFDWSPRDLLRGCGLAMWEFDHLVAGQAPFEPYVVARKTSAVMDLADGFAAYLERLRVSAPETAKRTPSKERKLGREVGEVRFDFDARDPDALRTVMDWKSAQYRRTGMGDRFALPWVVGLVEHLLGTRSDGCTGTLSMLYAGDEPVAGHFGLRSATVLATWFPTYDPRFSKYSPGLILHLRMAESAAAAGVRQLDMGKGTTRYKESFKSGDLLVAEGWVGRHAGAGVLRWAKRAPLHAVRNVLGRARRAGRPAPAEAPAAETAEARR